MSIKDAAARCGWKRANTFREWFLASEDDARAMGLEYDDDGRATVDAQAVEEAVRVVEQARAARARDWRVRNLGEHARKRPRKRASPDRNE